MRRVARLLVPLVLLLPAACGTDNASAHEIVARAPKATVAASTAAVTMHLEMHGLRGAGDVSFDATGGIDFAHQRSAMTMDLSRMFAGLGLDDVDGTVEARTAGTDVYLRSALFQQLLGADAADRWVKFDMAKVSAQRGLDLSQLQQPGTNDPAQQLALLEGVSEGGVREVGHEKIGGVDTTRYRARVDLERAARRAGGITDEDAFRRFVDQMGTKTVVVNVWIDGDDHVRRIAVPMPLPKDAGDGTASMTMEYDHFGEPVDVAVPPAAQVVDLQGLLDRTGSGGSLPGGSGQG